ncbi:uncharacterized protein LOC132042819 [Lycium ferocissimum]|uniref:uncharacterized protein LOC132042819 n=1 Tax=Lycium ferocissimum TaxID=112874 RepID=UPI002815A1FB|nr:uncharacterized protein LOC132042819 [Lycium ferocissimum]
MGESIGLVKILKKRMINIACVQETKWVGPKAKEVDGYKLWFSGKSGDRNGVGILVDSELRDQVVEVRRVNDRMMTIKLVVGGFTLNIISAYAPQVGLDEEVKRRFWEDLDEVVGGEKLMALGAWESRGDASSMWDRTSSCIREAAREVLGVSRGRRGGHRGDWWWNGEVQGKVEAKKQAYAKLVDNKDDEEKRTNRQK